MARNRVYKKNRTKQDVLYRICILKIFKKTRIYGIEQQK